MKYLEISLQVRTGDEQPESIIYRRTIAVPEGLPPEDWQEQSASKIKQASDEVAQLLGAGTAQQAKA
jgi:hypothetical protein